jgi:hypothetical protein
MASVARVMPVRSRPDRQPAFDADVGVAAPLGNGSRPLSQHNMRAAEHAQAATEKWAMFQI